jgi:hypothetical protein
MVDSGNSYSDWALFFSNRDTLIRGLRLSPAQYFPVIGNHEYFTQQNGLLPGNGAQMIYNINPWIQTPSRSWGFYALPSPDGSSYFIVLDSDERTPDKPDQLAWFKQELVKAQAYRHVFLMQHVPFFSSAVPATASNSQTYREDLTSPYWLEMQKYSNVKMVFNGHSHWYERIKRVGTNKIINVTLSSAGSMRLTSWNTPRKSFSDKIWSNYGYGMVTVWDSNVYFEAFDYWNNLIDSVLW